MKELRKAVQDMETSQKLLKQKNKEFKELKKVVQDIKTIQDLLSRKCEDKL